MLSANFKPKRTAAALRGFLATARLSYFDFRVTSPYGTDRETDGGGLIFQLHKKESQRLLISSAKRAT